MPLPDSVVREIIEKANEIRNPATGDRLGDVLEDIILACAKSVETEDELLDCIEDALSELKEVIVELKRKR